MFNIIRFYTSTISQCSSEVIIGSGNGSVPVHNTKTLHESMLTYCQLDLEEQILGKMKSNYKKFCLIESNKIFISVECFCKCHSQTVYFFQDTKCEFKLWLSSVLFCSIQVCPSVTQQSQAKRTQSKQSFFFSELYPPTNEKALCFCGLLVPDSKVHGATMGPTWVLSAPDGPHVGPMNLAIRGVMQRNRGAWLRDEINGLVQDCSISIALAMEILQSGTGPLKYSLTAKATYKIKWNWFFDWFEENVMMRMIDFYHQWLFNALTSMKWCLRVEYFGAFTCCASVNLQAC